MKTMKNNACLSICMTKSVILILLIAASLSSYAQTPKKSTAAVLGIDSKGVIQDAEAVGFMVTGIRKSQYV